MIQRIRSGFLFHWISSYWKLATKIPITMFIKSPRMLMVMSIGLFVFGICFGFLAFPKFLRHMISSVSECGFSWKIVFFFSSPTLFFGRNDGFYWPSSKKCVLMRCLEMKTIIYNFEDFTRSMCETVEIVSPFSASIEFFFIPSIDSKLIRRPVQTFDHFTKKHHFFSIFDFTFSISQTKMNSFKAVSRSHFYDSILKLVELHSHFFCHFCSS